MELPCVTQEDLRLAIELVKDHIDGLWANVGGMSCHGEPAVSVDNLAQAVSLIKGYIDEAVAHVTHGGGSPGEPGPPGPPGESRNSFFIYASEPLHVNTSYCVIAINDPFGIYNPETGNYETSNQAPQVGDMILFQSPFILAGSVGIVYQIDYQGIWCSLITPVLVVEASDDVAAAAYSSLHPNNIYFVEAQ